MHFELAWNALSSHFIFCDTFYFFLFYFSVSDATALIGASKGMAEYEEILLDIAVYSDNSSSYNMLQMQFHWSLLTIQTLQIIIKVKTKIKIKKKREHKKKQSETKSKSKSKKSQQSPFQPASEQWFFIQILRIIQNSNDNSSSNSNNSSSSSKLRFIRDARKIGKIEKNITGND